MEYRDSTGVELASFAGRAAADEADEALAHGGQDELAPAAPAWLHLPPAMGHGADAYSQTAAQLARDDLIMDHLWLVRHIASRLTASLPSGTDAENLESAGVLGLVEAASRYDAGRGVPFKAYASVRIRGAMVDELRRNCPLPQELLAQVGLVHRAQERLDPPVTIEALVAETGLTEDQVVDCLAAVPLTQLKSLDQIGGDWFRDRFEAPDESLQREDLKRLLAEAIEALPRRERLCVTLYYMEDLRLKEIGHVLGLSESRISRLLTAAQYQMREYVRTKN
ncbi:MAG: sigma-70 family RNA polymerase sigma factor [Planctomycetes bacterium]|nr:sigma-70 family RNA polymerase sigma factor [Planctomycetota bacterium]